MCPPCRRNGWQGPQSENDPTGEYVLHSEAQQEIEKREIRIRAAVDNGDRIMAELKIAVKKCVEQDKEIAELKAEVEDWKKAWRIESAALKQAEKEIAELKEKVAARDDEIMRLTILMPLPCELTAT